MPRTPRVPPLPRLSSPEATARLLQLHEATHWDAFLHGVRELLGTALPHDALVVYLNFVDFATTWQASRIYMTENAVRPKSWFEGRRRVDMTPQFVLSRPQRLDLYRLSDVVPDPRELRRTAFFREYLAPNGWHHLAVALFWQDARVCSQIALRRTRAQGDFTPAEMAVLRDLMPHIGAVHGRLLRQEEERARLAWMEDFSQHLPFAILTLSAALEVTYANREAMEVCAIWRFGPERARAYNLRDVLEVPREIRRGCEDLRDRARREGGERGSPAGSLRVAHPSQPGLVATIAFQAPLRSCVVKPGFVVLLARERDAREPAALLPVHSVAGELTVAEREVVRHVLAGRSNREIACALGKSVNTVKSQLTGIYRKLGVTTRSQLIARLR